MSGIRLQVAIAKAGIASRRKAAHLIESNRVKVNGKTVRKKGFRVDASRDRITVDGRAVGFEEKKYYYILNKPAGALSTAADERGRKTVLDCVGKKGVRLYPVGRLDKDTTGLIILTNDGDLTYRLTHPKFEVDKVYEVKAWGAVNVKDALRLKSGITIDGESAKAEKFVFKKKTTGFTIILITLHEGRKREVRRMFEAIGHPVLKLKRVSYGSLRLGGLEAGAFRSLTRSELVALRRSVGLA